MMNRPNLSELTKKIDDCKTHGESVNAVVDYVGECENYMSVLEKALWKLACFIVDVEDSFQYVDNYDNMCDICPLEDCRLEEGYKCDFPGYWKQWAMQKAEEELKGE